MVFVQLFVMLIVILVAAEVFTNALEHLGERLKISEGVTGSLFAAIGTALPETMVPLLALLAGTDNTATNEEIGVGAILGAPLMLSTLTPNRDGGEEVQCAVGGKMVGIGCESWKGAAVVAGIRMEGLGSGGKDKWMSREEWLRNPTRTLREKCPFVI